MLRLGRKCLRSAIVRLAAPEVSVQTECISSLTLHVHRLIGGHDVCGHSDPVWMGRNALLRTALKRTALSAVWVWQIRCAFPVYGALARR